MSALAEPLQHVVPDDNLARRNAMVLAVAQTLAGDNNTIIVATSSIVGSVLAPDKGLATLPVTAMVFGCGSARSRWASWPVISVAVLPCSAGPPLASSPDLSPARR